MGLQDKQAALLLAVIVSIFFLLNLFFLFQSADLQGQDAPYYLRGVEAIQETGLLPAGVLEYPPVFFYTASLFSLFAGTVSGIKIAAALFGTLSGIAVFLLARQLFKSNEAAIVSTIFFLIAPVSMRLLNGFWKTSAALLFLPLFFYFFFRSEKSNKNLLIAFAMLLLVFLSHKLVALLALLVLLSFVIFQLVFERKIAVETKNFLKIAAVFAVLFLFAFFASQKNVSDLLGLFGLINSVSSNGINPSLWQYYGAIVIAAFFGALYCFFSAKKEQLFLLSWFIIGLFVAMPLTSGDNYWRFAFLLAMPFALLSGLFFSELRIALGRFNSALVFFVIAILALPLFYNAAAQIVPVYGATDVSELRQAAIFSKDAEFFSRGALSQWLQYLGFSATDAGENLVLAAKQSAESGKNVFLVIDKQRQMLDYSAQELGMINSNFFVSKETARFLFLRPDLNAAFPQLNQFFPSGQAAGKKPRFSSPVLWLFFPAEFFNFFPSLASSALRALIGLPFSIALIAFILLQLKKLEKNKDFRAAAFILVALLVFLVAFAK